MNTAFESLALVFNDVFGLLTGGVDSIKKVGEAFDKFFGKPIETAVASFQKFGSAFSKIFGQGDFTGALDDVKEGFSGLGDAISQTGDGFVEAATDAADYVVNIKDAAVENVNLAKSAELAEAKNVGLLEKFDRAAEKQRQIRDEERNSIEKRIEANEKLGEILEEQNKTMLENANIALKSAQANFEKNKSTENEVALIQAKNEVLAVESTVEGFRSEQKANDLALDKERIELKNTEFEADTNRNLAQQKFEAEQEETEAKRLERLIEINEKEKKIQTDRLQGIINEANLGTQARIDAESALKDFIQSNNQELLTLSKLIESSTFNLKSKIAKRYPSLDLEINGLPQFLNGQVNNNKRFNTKSSQISVNPSLSLNWDIIDPQRGPEIKAAKDSLQIAKNNYFVGPWLPPSCRA